MIPIRKSLIIRPMVIVLILVTCLLSLTGCWDRVEINDLAIVTAAGFDLTDDNKIRLTVQLFTPTTSSSQSGSGESSSGSQQNQPLVESAVGINAADAASKLQGLLSRKFFWGQSDIFIFSKKLAKNGLNETFDYLVRHPLPRERANLYISLSDTTQILQWKPNIERNSAEVLREMSALQTGLSMTLLKAVVELSDESHTVVIPWVKMKGSGNKTSPYIGGAASIKHMKMNHLYDVQKTRGLLWVRDEINTAHLTNQIPGDAGQVSLEIINSRSNLKPYIKDDQWIIKVNVRAAGNLNENTTDMDTSNPKSIKELEKQFAAIISDRIQKAVNHAQKTNTDILGFAEQFHRHYPKQWKKHEQEWDELFPQIKVEYHVTASILRTGMIGNNKAMMDTQGD
ncbi:MAG: Ger(x)C family spore germination protein [Candidatus Pristimantibacillus sp.]